MADEKKHWWYLHFSIFSSNYWRVYNIFTSYNSATLVSKVRKDKFLIFIIKRTSERCYKVSESRIYQDVKILDNLTMSFKDVRSLNDYLSKETAEMFYKGKEESLPKFNFKKVQSELILKQSGLRHNREDETD